MRKAGLFLRFRAIFFALTIYVYGLSRCPAEPYSFGREIGTIQPKAAESGVHITGSQTRRFFKPDGQEGDVRVFHGSSEPQPVVDMNRATTWAGMALLAVSLIGCVRWKRVG